MSVEESCKAELWNSEGRPTTFLVQLICLGYAPWDQKKCVLELADMEFSGRLEGML